MAMPNETGAGHDSTTAREQYANIEEPNIDQTSPHQPKAALT